MSIMEETQETEKEAYRLNRKAGWRGQGEYPDPVIGEADIEHHAPNTRKERRKEEVHGIKGRLNRATARQKEAQGKAKKGKLR